METITIEGLPPIYIRHANRRTIGLKFTQSGQFELYTAPHISIEFLTQFIHKNNRWIKRLWHKHLQHKTLLTEKGDDQLFFRGKWYTLLHDPTLLHLCAEVENTLYFAGDIQKRNVTVLRWLKLRAKKEIPEKVFTLAEKLHYLDRIKQLRITDTRSRWGSCSSRGTLSLSWRLILMPDFVCDYIITHELAHFSHMNHSAAFWKTVSELSSDYKLAEQWLKERSHLLHYSAIQCPNQ